MIENLIWCKDINRIGGVTSVIYYLVQKYADKPITVLYENADDNRLYQFSHYCDLIKFTGQSLECKNFFSSYSCEDVEPYIKYEKAYNVVHANYEFLEKTEGRKYYLGDFETLAVSKWAGEHCGRPYRVCYNPVLVGDKKAILLVSATRLALDKGDIADRMDIFARRLRERNIPYVWLCFTGATKNIPGIIRMPSEMDVQPYLKMADFVVQLSTSEACCMTYLESLALGTPVICTKIPSFYEQGGNEHNSIFLDFDMSNVDEAIDRMSEKFDFKFTPKEDLYGELLTGDRKEKPIPMKMIKVRLTDKWQEGGGIVCKDIDCIPYVNQEIIVSEERSIEMVSKGRTVIVGPVEEPKVEVKNEEPKVETKVEKKKKK